MKIHRFYSALWTALLASPFHTLAQDTALVAFRKFPLPVLSMVGDDKGVIWFNTDKDLYRFEGDGFQWEKTIGGPRILALKRGKLDYTQEEAGISSPYAGEDSWASKLPDAGGVYFSATDKQGTTWVTHGRNFYGFKITPFFKKSLSGHSLRGIYTHENALYVNSYSGLFKDGILLYPGQVYSNGNALGISSDEIWIPSREILRYQVSLNRFSALPYGNPGELDGQFTYLHQSEDSQIWAGNSKGLFRIVDGTVFGTGFSKPVEYISSTGNLLYIASKQGIFTGDGAAFVPLKAFPLISYTSIQKIGDTWWACSDKGLWKWEEGQEQAEPYFADQPFGNLQTYGILQDESGHYWVSSASGLYRFREDSPEPKPYLTHIEFNKRSFAAIRDSFYFGSVNGLVAFNPLDFPLMDAQSAGRQPNPAYLKPGIILLLAVVVVFFYVQWKRTQRRIDSLRHKQRQRDAM